MIIKAWRTRTRKERAIGDRDFLMKFLKTVNEARKATGLRKLWRIPKGHRGMSCECPTARALNNGFAVGTMRVRLNAGDPVRLQQLAKHWDVLSAWGATSEVRMPSILREFISRFDTYQFPQLMEEEKK